MIATLASALMLSSTIAAALVLSDPAVPKAEARYATAGTGVYLGAIDWFEWGAHSDAIPATGLTKSNTRTIAGGTLTTTCTIGTITGGGLRAYRPGSWTGDGLDEMYRIGGTGGSNELIAGLANAANGTTISFPFSCSATLDGNPVPLAGLVMADAEQSGSNEYVQATVPAGAQWRLIDRTRTANCNSDTAVTRTGQTLRLTGPTSVCASGPDGVAFMDGATSADVTMKGGGISAIALGVMLFNDFGDAPASYGEAGALYSPGFAGSTVPEGNSSLFGATLNTPTQPTTRLGAVVDSEADSQESPGATGDGADEDAIAAPAPIVTEPGNAYSLPTVACTGPGEVSGWIDWDGNGSFQLDERSNVANCAGASAALSWTVPADARTSSTFLRLRIAPSTGPAVGPTGVTTAGEVEDYALSLTVPSDSGDAPDSYGTLTASGGARHDVTDFNVGANTAPLMLGTKVDGEFDGVPSAGASGDDTAGIDDEDALASAPVFSAGSTTASVSATVTNSSGTGATLYGWVDADLDGAFEASEFASAPVAAGATTASLSWTGLPSLQLGASPMVRLRLTSATLTDNTGTAAVDERSRGAATDGEVEDYLASVEPPAVDCSTDSAVFNTAFNGSGGKLPAGSRDRFWEVGIGNDTGPASVSSYVPAFVIPPVAGAWDASPFGNADWISYNTNGSHAARIETYFRYRFRIDAAVPLDGFALQMDFLADNSVPEVWINGTPQSPTQDGLPQTTGNAYQYVGFKLVNRARTVLSDGFQYGANDIVVRVASDPGFVGFMAQMQQSPLCNDWGDAPNTYGTDAASGGASHGVSNAAAAQLRLGDAVDVEPEGLPGTGADGDDAAGTDDEDGVADPMVITEGVGSTVRVAATNDTNQIATMAGWIDLNGNGSFGAGERVLATVPANSGTASYDLDFPAGSTTSDTYARFRLFPGNVADPAPTGSAPAGEVEDHSVTVGVPGVDFGDAPSTYATTLADGGPSHQLIGYDPVADTADVMLGASADREPDGQPNLAATGDDTADADDEDGVAFNPALGYPNPTIRTGTDPVTLGPVSNTLEVTASDDGFASVWVDWNIDGDFADPGERVTNAQPVTAGANAISFAQGTNPEDIRTYARVRFSTDAGSIADPTGPAPDGEVEDYRVLLERLITPAACSTIAEPFYAMTFPHVGTQTGTGAVDSSTRYNDVTVVGGVPVDVEIQVITGSTRLQPVNGIEIADGTTDDAGWNIPGAGTTLRYSFFRAGTTTAIAVNGVWTVNDMDNTERARWQPPSDIAGYAITPGSEVTVDTTDTRWLDFKGTRSGNSDTWSRFQVWFQGRTTVQAIWSGFQNSGFGIDGDGDIPIVPSCADYGDAPDSYATREDVNGPRHTVDEDLRLGAELEFDGNGQPSVNADGDDLNRVDDEDGVAAPIVMTAGEPTTVNVVATNDTGAAATLAGWLDLDGDGTFDVNERLLLPVAAGTATYPVVFPPGPSSTTTAYARFRLFPGTVTDASPTGAANAGEVEDYPVQVLSRNLIVVKTSNATPDARPGDTITYTVTVTNTGTGAFTAANPARFVDDLTAVLDDADYTGDAAVTVDGNQVGTVGYTQPRIRWEGPLAGGKSAVLTYTVTLTGGGDGTVRNVAWAPPTTDPGPTPDCDDPGVTVPCDEAELLLPKLQIRKVASTDALPAVGGEITYTVTVRNVGPGTYTPTAPATYLDDLTDVEDDANLKPGSINASSGTPLYNAPELTWSGALAPNGEATVSYTFIYNETGDKSLVNVACVPDEEAANPDDACARTTTPGSGLDQAKTASPTSGTAVDAGDVITYTLRFSNTGQTPAAVDTSDDLSDVLDDADLVEGPTAEGSLTAVRNGDVLDIGGTVPVGQTLTVTYKVQVKPFGGQGDHRLANALACQPGEPQPCPDDTTEHPVRGLVIDKSSDATPDAHPGDVITYTISARNDGLGDYTSDDPAIVLDALSDVLDDAEYNGDATATIDGNPTATAPVFVEPLLSWSGALAAGKTVVITYSITLSGGGDGTVENVAFAPDCDPTLTGCTPTVPECDNGVDPDTGLPCDTERLLLPKLSITKTASSAEVGAVGDEVTYSVTVTNDGPGDYTAGHLATFSDNLTQVLDDATFVDGSITITGGGTASFTSPEVTWSGELPAGAHATITYKVRYTGAGDRELVNDACVIEAEATDPAQACDTVTVGGPHLVQTKTSDPADGESVGVGDEIEYTLTFANDGSAAALIDTTDDLSDVLDDADLVAGPTAQAGLTATTAGDSIVITGFVLAGETRTVTYTVQVTGAGDGVLSNVLACQPGEPLTCEPETTEHPVRELVVTKTSTKTPDTRQGDTVSYTVTAENTGDGAYTVDDPAVVVDDLTEVLDDAVYNDDASASVGDDPTYAAPRLRWEGPLGPGGTVTITYTVTLRAGGDGVVGNVAWAPDPGDPDGPTPDCADPGVTVPCADEEFELPRLSIVKTSDRADLPAVGEHLTYTVVVKNEGPGDYTVGSPAEFTDDLTEVLDDATFDAGSITADEGDASFADPNLSWTGVLAAGEDAEITYSVTYTAKPGGDQQLDNNACVPEDEALDADEACDVVRVPGADLTQTKTSTPADGEPVDIGDEITYTLSFSNDGETSAIVDTTDDRSDVLDDAELVGVPSSPDGLTVTTAGDSLVITGIVPAGETYTVSYTVRVTSAGDGALRNTLACQPGEPLSCDPETTEHPVRKLKVTKTSNAAADTRQGDTITYTVTAENTGAGDYTADEPAQVVDDLSGVLDDGDYNDDATASVSADPSYTAPRLHWEGPLGPGDFVTISYTVTLKGGGDGVVRNVAWAPDPGDPAGPEPDCDAPAPAVPCSQEEYELPRLSIRKAADRTDLPAVGETMTYTVVVTNEGPGDYTSAAPATFTDDLSEVLDDATFVDGSITTSTGTASFADPNLSWSGVLAAGDDATVTYRVRYTGAGDHQLDNDACVPEQQAVDAAAACITVRVPGSGLVQRKSSAPESGTSVDAGDQITYTLKFINTGPAAATVDTTDNLSGVLDDAELTGGPDADAGLTATQNGNLIEIAGSVPAGETLEVTYTVTVKEYDAQGDHVLRNALACQPGEPAGCDPETTEHPVRSIELTKTSNATVDSRPGDVITYTVTARNRGTGDYTALQPAVVVDDLAGVIDDADFNDDASASIGGASAADPEFLAPRLAWSGPLAAGEAVTITYTVTLKGGGDGHVDNVAWAPDPGDPHGPTPDCDDVAITVPCGDESYELPKLSITKSADPAVVNAVGDIVTYTVIVKNDGPGDYSAAEPATFSDDLSAVLDDATFVAGSITATQGAASFATPELSWTGVLAAGQSSTVTYKVRYTGAGNRSLVNAACVPEAEATDPAEDCAAVTVPGAGLSQTKTADPESGTTVGAGDRITYTLTFTNTGTAPARVDTSDDLSGVLDDAMLVNGPTAEAGLTATRNGDRILITGNVPTGQTLTVAYTVEVEAFADQADHVLRNALACQPGEPADCDPERTEHPIGHLTVTKTSDAGAGIDTGDTVTYTITVLNDGATDFTEADPAVVVDDLSDVLDDATWGGASSDRGTTSFADPRLTWSGALPSGQKATITYAVTVTNNGDHDLGNIASVPECDEPGCNPPPVITDLPYVVPDKVSDPPSGQSVQAGDIVTYTLSWTNEGKAPGVVDATDDLSEILDDAELVGDLVSSSARVTLTRVGDTLRIVGPIDPGETVTVTYRVRIKPDGQRGDNIAGNVLTPDTPQVDCNEDDECEPVDPPVTENPIGDLDDSKSVDPSSGDPVAAGDKLTYTLTFISTGTGPVDVDREDDLSGVLDDATLVSGPTSSNPALQVSGPDGNGRIRITGTLEAGQTVTVTYTVRVKKKTDRGDGNLANFLVDPGEDPPPHCNVARAVRAAEPGDCTENPASEVEATKDVDLPHGSSVTAGDVLTYTLKFVNRGNGAGEVDYIDNVADVLDDVTWVSGPTSSDPALKARRDGNRLLITGTLDPGQVVTIAYQVRVKADGQRGNGQLLNYLFPEGGVSPTACQSDRDDCTENAVSPNAAPPPPGTDPGDLPDTGSQFGPGLLVAGLLSLLLGVGLVVASRRRGPGEARP